MSEMCPGSDRARTIECPGDCFTLFLCSSEVNLTSCQNTLCQNLEGESSESRVLENTTRRYPRMQPTGSGKTRAFQLQSSVHQPSNPRLMITMLGGWGRPRCTHRTRKWRWDEPFHGLENQRKSKTTKKENTLRLNDLFSTISKPDFATKHSLENSWRDLSDLASFARLRPQEINKFLSQTLIIFWHKFSRKIANII